MARNENTKGWLRRLFARAQPRTNDQPTEGFGETSTGMTTSTARNEVMQWLITHGNGALVQCGMGQLPYDDGQMIDIELKDFNWASLQCMDGVQVQTALKSFTPTSTKGSRP